ncbi:OmpP1/FadL family transporter [Tautonia plasticadhaerens]|uniref:OmpP1/FadL family transporter n=1 Tax=Tautonia plasticadhaerens TaxID=2527974 RepID=UPI0011AA669D|nr:outer membrane protein transport protein [Tautonia plasticadhaerens]
MRGTIRAVLGAVLVASWASTAGAQGIILPGAGPINRSMAGASTAAPIELGGTYWNPALLSAFESNQVLLGSELLIPSTHFTGTLPAGAINGTFPPNDRYGVSRSDSGVASNLATGVSFKLREDSPTTLGLLVAGFVGGNVNYAGSFSTPLLTPRVPPDFAGVGPIYGNASMLAITPMISTRIGDRLHVGGGPIISTLSLAMDPAFFAPGPRDEFGLVTFPSATHSRPFWGGGFQFGLLYEVNDSWNVGFSYKSPIWQERWSFNSSTPDLVGRRIGVDADIPQIFSWGVAYKGIDRLLVDVDLRYFDYQNAALFGQRVVDGGLGWDSIFAVASGASYQLSDRLTLRGGYSYNENPIRDNTTLFNVQLPGILQHNLSLGASLKVTENVTFTAGWVHSFRNSSEGQVTQVPGATAKFDTQLDSILAGINIEWGTRCPECHRHHVDHGHGSGAGAEPASN